MIAKTRQRSIAKIEEAYDPEVGKARGVLRRNWTSGKLRHSRRCPSPNLALWIAHYWFIEWDLRGCPAQMVENLPHPNVHLIFEDGGSVISGVQTRKFSRVLEGNARVFGVKFQPGGFHPFLNSPVSSLADRLVPASRFFGKALRQMEAMVLLPGKESELVRTADDFFEKSKPEPDPMLNLATEFVRKILEERDIKTVEHLANRVDMGTRQLQRLFNEYVGVSPKWVIRRYRLHELIETMNRGGRIDWVQVALELGYVDQAHLINDFKSVLGHSPVQYKKLLSDDGGDKSKIGTPLESQ